MDVSPAAASAVASFDSAGSGVKAGLAVVALKSAIQSEAVLLQLFEPATKLPAPPPGRGGNVDTVA